MRPHREPAASAAAAAARGWEQQASHRRHPCRLCCSPPQAHACESPLAGPPGRACTIAPCTTISFVLVGMLSTLPEYRSAACYGTSYSCIPQRSWSAQHPAGLQVAPGHLDPPTAHASPRLVIGWPLRCSPSPRSYSSCDVASAARSVRRHQGHEVVDSRSLTLCILSPE